MYFQLLFFVVYTLKDVDTRCLGIKNIDMERKDFLKKTFALLLISNFILTVYCQDFKIIKPTLTDSTKVVKTEIEIQLSTSFPTVLTTTWIRAL